MTDAADAVTSAAPSRAKIIVRVLLLGVTGVAFYLVLPGLIAMFGSLPQLETVFPAWFVPIFLLEAAAFASIWVLMRIALHTDKWFDVACAQLTGNALSRALPGGAAAAGAVVGAAAGCAVTPSVTRAFPSARTPSVRRRVGAGAPR